MLTSEQAYELFYYIGKKYFCSVLCLVRYMMKTVRINHCSCQDKFRTVRTRMVISIL